MQKSTDKLKIAILNEQPKNIKKEFGDASYNFKAGGISVPFVFEFGGYYEARFEYDGKWYSYIFSMHSDDPEYPFVGQLDIGDNINSMDAGDSVFYEKSAEAIIDRMQQHWVLVKDGIERHGYPFGKSGKSKIKKRLDGYLVWADGELTDFDDYHTAIDYAISLRDSHYSIDIYEGTAADWEDGVTEMVLDGSVNGDQYVYADGKGSYPGYDTEKSKRGSVKKNQSLRGLSNNTKNAINEAIARAEDWDWEVRRLNISPNGVEEILKHLHEALDILLSFDEE